MIHGWETQKLDSEEQVFAILEELVARRWLWRGQSDRQFKLEPSIDRGKLKEVPRIHKLGLERQSIELFRSTARFFAGGGESGALLDDIVTLMVLRHYGVPTRLLDWLLSPFVAAYFAVSDHDGVDGAIWTFDEALYEKEGRKQWEHWPETTTDGTGNADKFDAKLTAFTLDEPQDWFCCGFYKEGFPRQRAQAGAYTMTARFGRNHADAVANLLPDKSAYRLYIVGNHIKKSVRKILRDKYGIWRGSLFPDSAGAADTASIPFRDFVK